MLKMYDEINSALWEIKGLLVLHSFNDYIYESLLEHQSKLIDLKNSLFRINSEEVRQLKRDIRRALGGFYRFINQIS